MDKNDLLIRIKDIYSKIAYPIVLSDNKANNIVIDRHKGELMVVCSCRDGITEFFPRTLEPNSNKFAYNNYIACAEILFEQAKQDDILTLREWINNLNNKEIISYTEQSSNIYLDILGRKIIKNKGEYR